MDFIFVDLGRRENETEQEIVMVELKCTSVQNSLTFSKTMLQCLSKALTLARSFLLLRQLMRTWELVLTLVVSTERGPVRNNSSSFFSKSSIAIASFPDCRKYLKISEEDEFKRSRVILVQSILV